MVVAMCVYECGLTGCICVAIYVACGWTMLLWSVGGGSWLVCRRRHITAAAKAGGRSQSSQGVGLHCSQVHCTRGTHHRHVEVGVALSYASK